MPITNADDGVPTDQKSFGEKSAISPNEAVEIHTAYMNARNVQDYDNIARLAGILEEIFPDEVWDDGVQKTAARVMRYWKEYNTPLDTYDFTPTIFDEDVDQLITCTHIEFASLCPHHLLPYFGTVHVGYISHGKTIGLSKMPRLVKWAASRPITQENLGELIAKHLKDLTNAKGAIVILSAKHTCVTCRGARSNAVTSTSVLKGVMLTAGDARREFFDLVRLGGA